MRIPDTVEGALVISGIDFLLSFLVIGGIGAALALLPGLDRLLVIRDSDLEEGH